MPSHDQGGDSAPRPFDTPGFMTVDHGPDLDLADQINARFFPEQLDEALPSVDAEPDLVGSIDAWQAREKAWATRHLLAEAAQDAGETRLCRNAVLRYRWLISAAAAELADQDGDEQAADEHRRVAASADAELISSNEGIARSISSRFTKVAGDWGEDINAEAVAELVGAVRKWDPERSTLAHFAQAYVNKAAKKAVIFNERPQHTYAEFTASSAVREAESEMRAANGGQRPSDAQIAAAVGVSANVVAGTRVHRPVSLDLPIGDGGGATLGDLVAEEVPAGSPGFDGEMLREGLLALTSVLTPLARAAVLRRAGLHLGAPGETEEVNISEVAEWLSRGREETRALLAEADRTMEARAGELIASGILAAGCSPRVLLDALLGRLPS